MFQYNFTVEIEVTKCITRKYGKKNDTDEWILYYGTYDPVAYQWEDFYQSPQCNFTSEYQIFAKKRPEKRFKARNYKTLTQLLNLPEIDPPLVHGFDSDNRMVYLKSLDIEEVGTKYDFYIFG